MKFLRQVVSGIFALGIAATVTVPAKGAPGDLLWMRELGNRARENARGLAIDADGNIVIAGRTEGSLDGRSAGAWDAIVAKFDRDGNQLWVRQLGGVGYDWATGVAVGLGGSVVITGRTDGSLGGTNNGLCDGFVASYSPDGDLSWVRQFGGAGDDWPMGVATDRLGYAYVAGGAPGALTGPVFTRGTPATPPLELCATEVLPGQAGWPKEYNAFLIKYDAAGTLRWTRRLGTSLGEGANAVATDFKRGILITGSTFGSLGAPVKPVLNDIFFAKYSLDGTVLWVRQYGARGSDGAWGMATDRERNIIIAGDAFSTFAGPWVSSSHDSDQAWAAKFSPEGDWRWIRQIATRKFDAARAAATDAAGNVYVTGRTDGDLAAPNGGNSDAFIAALSPVGNVLWIKQLGWSGSDWARGIAVDPSQDSVVISGVSSFPDPVRGSSSDVMIAKFAIR